MGFTPEQVREMEERLVRNRKRPTPVALPPPTPRPLDPPKAPAPSLVCVEPDDLTVTCSDRFTSVEFTYHGKPIGKPRMTQRDTWMRRPAVVRYRQFADALREAAGGVREGADMVLVTAWVAMPESWTKKKKAELVGQPCRQRPDWDNIGKAVCDSLFDEDCCIWAGLTMKYWCYSGQERVHVRIFYAKPK
jgi:Holliday junction resolvase RusA-like endonuclease